MHGYYQPLYQPIGYRPVPTPPVLPAFTDLHHFQQKLIRAIFAERTAQRFYSILRDRAITPFQKRMIQAAIDDENKHEQMLTDLYHKLTGHAPQVPLPGKIEVSDFQEGIKHAFEDELQAAETYRTLYLNTTVPYIRDLLFEIMTDELEHAQRFTFIRAEL